MILDRLGEIKFIASYYQIFKKEVKQNLCENLQVPSITLWTSFGRASREGRLAEAFSRLRSQGRRVSRKDHGRGYMPVSVWGIGLLQAIAMKWKF
jgi:hypothetical protein